MRLLFAILNTRRFLPALLALGFVVVAKAGSTASPTLGGSGEWRASLGGFDRASEDYAGKLVRFRFDTRFKYLLSDSLRFEVSPSLRFASGSVQTPDPKDGAENRVALREAGALWEPTSAFLLHGGALDQGRLHTSLLMDNRPFPAIRARAQFGDESLAQTRLFIESAVPTSTSLSTNTRELEPTPGFHTAAIEISAKPSARLEWSVLGGAFVFQNPPSAVAQESALFGNTVDRLSETQSVFRNGYRGFEAQARVWIPIKRWNLRLSAEGLQNQDAPQGMGSAWMAGGAVGYRLTARDDIFFGGRAFHIEPDAAVASFANSDYGYTNRNGYAAEMTLSFEKSRYELSAAAGETDLIYANYPQSRDRFLRLKLETSYAGF